MARLPGAFRRLAGLLRKRKLEAEMAEEMQAHLDGLIERHVAAGMSPEEARCAALRQFGGVDQLKEQAREVRESVWLLGLWRDLLYGVRQLRSAPGFAAINVLTLAVGIGACTAVFSIVNAVVLRPLAFPSGDRLVSLRVVLPAFAQSYPTVPVNARFFEEWRKCPAFAELALVERGRSTLTGLGEPLRISTVRTSANFFATLGVAPSLGRAFAAGEDSAGKAAVVVLSDLFWRRQFGASRSVLGRTLMINQQPVTVIGVLPPGFRFPQDQRTLEGPAIRPDEPDAYLPKVLGADELNEIVGRFNYGVVGRLSPGVALEEAATQMDATAARLAKLSGTDIEIRGQIEQLQESVVGSARRGLFLLLGAISAVLLIACLNLAMLSLARAERRSHEFAVRAALGATRTSIIRQLLVEALVLSLTGGALGCLFAYLGFGLILHFAPADLPRLGEVRIDSTVLLFALLATMAATVLTGLAPAWRMARANETEAGRAFNGKATTSGRGARRLRHVLVAVEAGLSMVLLAAATLLATSFMRLVQADPGFRAPKVLWTEVSVPYAKYPSDDAQVAYRQRLLAAIAETPGVTSTAIANALPLEGETWIDAIWIPGDSRPESERAQTNVRFVSADFFSTLGIPLRGGRSFADADRKRKVAVLSAQLAARLWPGVDPIGRRVLTHSESNGYEIVGVVGDVRANADENPAPVLYLPFWEWPAGRLAVVSRIQGPPTDMARSIRQSIRSLDGDVPVSPLLPMDDIFSSSVARRVFELRLVAGFALAALGLAALGIYGVVSHSVARRTRELGIRIAFGAEPSALRRMVLVQGLRPLAWGILAGTLAAIAGGRIVASLLYATNPHDPLALAGVATVLLAVACAACWLPARRAGRVDVARLLGSE